MEIPDHKLQELALEAMWKNNFFDKHGLYVGRQPITTLQTVWKSRVRGVGNRVYRRPPNETFHQFLGFYLSETLGHEWLAQEMQKPVGQGHLVATWVNETHELMNAQSEQMPELPVKSVLMSGNSKALHSLAYDLYSIRLSGEKILPTMVNRIKNIDQFQGARYEVAVAAIAIRAGFNINWIKEKGAHCEFVGQHRTTGDKAVFETKSHHREGVLGIKGEFNSENAKIKITDHVREARSQSKKDIPLIVFDDLNLPITGPAPLSEKRWFNDMDRQLRTYGFLEPGTKNSFGNDNMAMLCVTNFSWHHHKEHLDLPNEVLTYFQQGSPYSLKLETIQHLEGAAKQYGFVTPYLEEIEEAVKAGLVTHSL
ncbi:MAG: hypothetical protein UW86_C0007G0014 [Microgenomates group bacterium GW2011_GWA1_Microgenomates_45_10]|nr:MAG: hypothetical protein UW86_C0007G0014 [Microgenomates group bacterium GW2011_GWA1_Microgenomates_45_10]